MTTAVTTVRRLHADSFRAGWEHLTDFVATHGHATVPTTTVVNGFRLGQWVSRCRSAYRAATLTPEQIVALETLPGWEWTATHRQGCREAQFVRGVEVLRRYVTETGTSDVPFSTVFDGFNLGVWARSIRLRRRRGRLAPHRIAAVETAAPGWLWERCYRRGAPPLRFEDAARLAADYVTKVGVCDPQPGQRHRGFAVGLWLLEQRINYHRGQLTSEQATLLQNTIPGWTWWSPHDQRAC